VGSRVVCLIKGEKDKYVDKGRLWRLFREVREGGSSLYDGKGCLGRCELKKLGWPAKIEQGAGGG